MQIKLTKARREFYLMNKDEDSKVTSKFLDAQLLIKLVIPNPAYLIAHNTALQAGALATFNLTRVEVKSFTFASGSQSLSIDNAVLRTLPKRLLFPFTKKKDFLGSVDTNPFRFPHFDISNFAMYVNGKQIPSSGISLNMDHEKTSVMGYRSLFEESGIRHSNMGLQITNDMYTSGYFMLLFDLTPDHGAAEGHTSHPDSGNIRIELKFKKALPVAITCILYLEYDNCVRIDSSRTVTTDFS
jgi:hypothetical protein